MTEETNTNGKHEIQFPEAPASWNTRYVHPLGFECQITLRAERGLDLMEKVEAATAFLIKNGCEPYLYRLNGSKKELEEEHTDDPAWCPIHHCLMKRWEKDGKTWYSHKVNGSWCSGE